MLAFTLHKHEYQTRKEPFPYAFFRAKENEVHVAGQESAPPPCIIYAPLPVDGCGALALYFCFSMPQHFRQNPSKSVMRETGRENPSKTVQFRDDINEMRKSAKIRESPSKSVNSR